MRYDEGLILTVTSMDEDDISVDDIALEVRKPVKVVREIIKNYRFSDIFPAKGDSNGKKE